MGSDDRLSFSVAGVVVDRLCVTNNCSWGLLLTREFNPSFSQCCTFISIAFGMVWPVQG